MVAATLNLTLGAVSRPFACRKGTIDEVAVAQALKVGAYDVSRLRRGSEFITLYERLAVGGAPPLIVDTAANIGAAAVFFRYKFPKARILALEPDVTKFALLIANTRGLPSNASKRPLLLRPVPVPRHRASPSKTFTAGRIGEKYASYHAFAVEGSANGAR